MTPDPLATDFVATLGHRFRFVRLLGSGRNARVAEAVELATGERVAVKILHAELAASIEADRFVREMEWLQRLRHPRLGTIRLAGVAQGRVYYVMPFVDGPTLRQAIDADGTLDPYRVQQIAEELLDALAHAHATGVVHRDIEPSNIILGPDGAVLIDFGLGRAIEAATGDRVTLSGVVLGTGSYMSPEQCRGDDCDGRSDLYGLACVLYEALAGRPPFTHGNPLTLQMQHLTEPAPPILAAVPVVPAGLAAAIMRALEKDPAARWQNAGAMLAAVRGR